MVAVLAMRLVTGLAMQRGVVLVAQRNVWRRSEVGGGAGDVQPSLVSP